VYDGAVRSDWLPINLYDGNQAIRYRSVLLRSTRPSGPYDSLPEGVIGTGTLRSATRNADERQCVT